MSKMSELASIAEDVQHEVDLYGSEARYDHAQRLKTIAACYTEVAAGYLNQASIASSDAQRAAHAAEELLKGSNAPEVFAVVAEYLSRTEPK